MPVTEFICPNGQKVGVEKCLKSCVREQRCMFLPTLRAVAKSVDRKLEQPTVTELIAGNRETYLKKMTGYAVSPESVLYALQGQGVHAVHDQYAGGAILSEERLRDDTTSGQFALYGQLLSSDDGVIELADPSRAGVVVPGTQPDNEDVLMLVMPMLLND